MALPPSQTILILWLLDKKDVDVDVLLLGWYKPQYQYSKELGQETLYRFQGSHAYLVSQRGAAKMFAMAPRMGRTSPH